MLLVCLLIMERISIDNEHMHQIILSSFSENYTLTIYAVFFKLFLKQGMIPPTLQKKLLRVKKKMKQPHPLSEKTG